MGMGIGKRYWVHIIKCEFGSLDKCFKFMNENKPKNNTQFFELRPLPNVKEKICNEYQVNLVEFAT